jgi:hypothetical protein
MGGFFVNYVVRGPNPSEVARLLAGRRAIVTAERNGCIVVFDKESDEQDNDLIRSVAQRMSADLRCVALATLIHDDDILWYYLYLNGKLADEYDSTPGYFDPEAEPSPPAGGNAVKLCQLFGASDTATVERILRDNDQYAFATDRLVDLVRVLGLPQFVAGNGYGNVAAGELREGLTKADLIEVT